MDPGVWINTILNNILNKLVWPVFVGISIIMFIVAGFMFMFAQGDPDKIKHARMAVLYGVIGIVVAIIGFSIVNIVTNVIAPPPVDAVGACCQQGANLCVETTQNECTANAGNYIGGSCNPNPCQ